MVLPMDYYQLQHQLRQQWYKTIWVVDGSCTPFLSDGSCTILESHNEL